MNKRAQAAAILGNQILKQHDMINYWTARQTLTDMEMLTANRRLRALVNSLAGLASGALEVKSLHIPMDSPYSNMDPNRCVVRLRGAATKQGEER